MTTTTTSAAAERARQKAIEAAFERVSKSWGPDLSPMALKPVLPLLNAKLEAAKAALDTAWEDAKAGRIPREQFDIALKAWENENYAAISALKAVR